MRSTPQPSGAGLFGGQRAREDVQRYSVENFKAAWRSFYEKLNAGDRPEAAEPEKAPQASFWQALK